MWTSPYRASVASAAACSSDLSETSAVTASTSALVCFSSATALPSACCSMSHIITLTPACARRVATPRPMPDAAPVMNAVLPTRSFIASSCSFRGRSWRAERQAAVESAKGEGVHQQRLGLDRARFAQHQVDAGAFLVGAEITQDRRGQAGLQPLEGDHALHRWRGADDVAVGALGGDHRVARRGPA